MIEKFTDLPLLQGFGDLVYEFSIQLLVNKIC